MIKINCIAFLCLLTLAACSADKTSFTQEQEIQVTSEVNQAFLGLVEASKTLDHARYFSYFDTEKYTALNEDGTVLHSFAVFQEIYMPQVAYVERYNDLQFDNVKIDVIDKNTAVLVNEYTAEVVLTNGDIVKAAGAGTQVWSKRTGEWKLVNVSSSAKPLNIK
ncbi:nuclear transport factor 2 family protein [Kordiimonas aquimaris]|uniref:nuclear transport factor 2 family protein n=1 Tax=Kordiimonas aquimaris TaxID=707591 RepID=UPI0021D12B6A|nr:nuclear transport factor 2 family protein [Kordiimonas aquimaris]